MKPNQIKVCHIISGDLWAGAEAVAFQLLLALASHHDIDTSAVILNKGALYEALKKSGIRVLLLEEAHLPFQSLVKAIRAYFRKLAPDVVHAHRYKENLLACLATFDNRFRKRVSTVHGLPEPYCNSPGIYELLKNRLNDLLLSRYFHKTITVSQDIRDQLVGQYFFSSSNTVVIHNGIRVPSCSSFTSTSEKDRPLIFGSAGRLVKVKNYPLLLHVAKALQDTGYPVQFVLAGEGPELESLQGMVVEFGLQDVFRLPGFTDDPPAFYRALGYYVCTSRHEGIPLTILEAMAHSLPVIAPRVGGIPEIINQGIDGLLVNSHQPKNFVSAITAIIQDHEWRASIAVNARSKIIREFSVESMALAYANLYWSLFSTKP